MGLVDLFRQPLCVGSGARMDFDDENLGNIVGMGFMDEMHQLRGRAGERLDRATPLLGFADFIFPTIDAQQWSINLNASGQARCYNLPG